MKKILFIFQSFLTGILFAQDQQINQAPETELDKVEAVGIAQNDLSTPINTTFISAQEISESGSNSVPELLAQKTTVRALTFSGNPNDANLAMRGFSENSQLRVAVIIDGIRYNRSDMANIPWQNIPMGNIKNVELLRGANSARYGNNAVAGIVKISTKDIAKTNALEISGMCGSYGTYSANAFGSVAKDDYFATVNTHRYYTDGYRDYSENWSNNYGASVGYFLNENNSIKITGSFSETYTEYPNPVSREAMKHDPRKATSATTIYDSTSYSVSASFERDASTSKGFTNLSFDSYDRTISASRTNNQYMITFATEYEVEVAQQWRVYAGFESQFSNIDVQKDISTKFISIPLTYRAEDSCIERLNLGMHAGVEHDITDDLTLDICGRIDVARTYANYIEQKHRLAFTPPYYEIYVDTNESYSDDVWQKGLAASVALNYKINKLSSVYAKFDQLFRYPSTDEIALYQGWGGAANMINFNPDLKPEIGQNFEIGYKFEGSKLTVNSSVYALFLHDEIMYFPTTTSTGTTVNDNVPDTMRLGADLYGAYDFGVVGVFSAISIIDARFIAGEYKNNDIPFVPTFNGFAGFFLRPHERATLTMKFNYTSQQYPMSDLENKYQKVPDWWTADLRLNVKFCKYANAFFAIDNIFNEHYTLAAVFDSYYPAMGRMFKVGLNLKF